jgi:hypothetical protein
MGKKMSTQAAKHELESLNDFQREFHTVEDIKEPIVSRYYRTYLKSTWHTTALMKLECADDSEELVYRVNTTFHLLIYTYMRFMLPAVTVKPKYKKSVQIAWCHNAGTNPVMQAVFKEDDDAFHTWDRIWADIFFQYYQYSGAGKRKAHNVGIGNITMLENFNTSLPAHPVNVDQPWFYSMDEALAFPIFYKGSQTRACHRYLFNQNVTDFLRMKVNTPKGWVDVTKNMNKYIDIAGTGKFGKPELWGRYGYITEAEIKEYKCKPNRVYYIKDVISCKSANINKFGTTAEIPISWTGNNPCLAAFWVAENQDATLKHNYSNYTTNTDNLYDGWDPIKTTYWGYGGEKHKFKDMPSDHFNIASSRKHFPSAPSEMGYHGSSIADDSTNIHSDISLALQNLGTKFECLISDNSFSSLGQEEDNDEEDSIELIDIGEGVQHKNGVKQLNIDISDSPSYITHVKLLILRKFTVTMTSGKVADKDNNSYKFEII